MSAASTPDSKDNNSRSNSLNPFDDPNNTSQTQKHDNTPIDPASILYVGHNATLTIAAESLVVLDESLKQRRDKRNCFGLFSRWTKATQAIPFRNILWVELNDLAITVKYAQAVGRSGKACRVGIIHYTLPEKLDSDHAAQWVHTLMTRAYPAQLKRRKRIKVLVNPFGGQGYAQQIWSREVEPIFAAARCEVDVEATAYRGHAVEITEKLDTAAFDVIAAASGDGLPHEIFNGLAKQKRPRHALHNLAVTQIPCGSGNALSLNTLGTITPSWAAVEIVKGLPAPIDLMAVTQGDQRFYSFLSQAVGIIAESDLGTESLRWMGALRFQWGVFIRLFGKTIYPAEISIATETADKDKIRQMQVTGKALEHDSWMDRHVEATHDDSSDLPPLQYGTVRDPLPSAFETVDHPSLGNFYVGNMPTMTSDVMFFPMALLQDGHADLVTISGAISRAKGLLMMTSVDTGAHMDYPEVEYQKVHGYRIIPRMDPAALGERQGLRWRITQWLGGAGGQTEGLIAIDGEKMPFEPFQVEVHQGLGTILARNNKLFEVSNTHA